MPTYLPAPEMRSPDGHGWNRLSLTGGSNPCSDECGLRPHTYAALWESLNRPAVTRYGGYGPCTRGGECRACPVFHALPTRLERMDPDDPRVRVWVLQDAGDTIGQPRVMVNPDVGEPGDHWSYPWMWAELRRLEGWKLGDHGRDEHGEFFWLIDVREQPDPVDLARRCSAQGHPIVAYKPCRGRSVCDCERRRIHGDLRTPEEAGRDVHL